MKNKHFTLLAFLLIFVTGAFAQCVIPITDGQPYTENFDLGTMECWTVESTGEGTWAVMTGTSSNVAAFQNAAAGDEARLISPTFDLSGVGGATFSFGYAMMALYNNDVLTVSYRTSETDPWHELGSYSFNDWQNVYEETFELPDISSTYQISFLGHSNGGYYIFIDNIEIISAGGCARPVSLETSEITAFSALLGWSTTGNEESWVLELNGNQRTVDSQPFLMEGLEPQTDYTFRVKANCSGGMESEWSYPASFKTHCDVITVTDEEPFFDDFEGSEEFICWYNEIISGIDEWVIDPGYTILNNTAFFIWLGGNTLLISPPLDITAVSHPTLRFNHKQKVGLSYGTVDQLLVGYRTNENENWQTLANFTEATEDWETVEFELPDPSATYQIVFNGIGHDAEGIYVDDVRVGNGQTTGIATTNLVMATVTPNPANDKVMVTADMADGEVTVFDISGRRMATAMLHNGCVELDLSGFAQGVYMARIAGAKGATTIKLIKE